MKKNNLCNFNFEKLGKDYFISNDFGNWLVINASDFNKISNNNFSAKSEIYRHFKKGRFFKGLLGF